MKLFKKPSNAFEFFDALQLKAFIFQKILERPFLFNIIHYLKTGREYRIKDDLIPLSEIIGINRKFCIEVTNAIKHKKPIIGNLWAFSNILFQGFDVTSITIEAFGIYASILDPNSVLEYLDKSNEEKFLMDGCSYQRCAYGTMLSGLFPDFAAFISYTHPCDSVVASYQNFDYLTNTPSFVVDSPYDRSPDSIKYIAKQYRELICFLEETLDQKFDWVKFKKSLLEYNQFKFYYNELSQMMRNIPSPVSSLNMSVLWNSEISFAGDIALTNAAKKLYENAKKRLKNNQGVVKNEKIRFVMWEPPLMADMLYTWLEREYGAVIISDYLMNYTSDFQIDTSSEDMMLESVATMELLRGMTRQSHGKTELATMELQSIIDNYSPDGIIFSGHQGCRYAHAHTKILTDLCKKNGLPSINLNGDLKDSRICSEFEVKKQMKEFIKINNWSIL